MSNKRKTILGDVFNDVIPDKPIADSANTNKRNMISVSSNVIERLRDVAWKKRCTLKDLADEAINFYIDGEEENRGEKYEARSSELKAGRPFKV